TEMEETETEMEETETEMEETETEMETTTAEQMAAPLDDTWDVAISPRAPPDKLHWNRYNPKQNARGTNAWDIMAFTHPGTEDRLFAPALLEDFSWDSSGPTLVFKLRDTKWWDGTQVDSQDLWTKAMMEAATNRRAHRVVANEYKQPDARTLRMKFGTSANPQVMQTQAIFRGMDTPYDQADKFFGNKADRVWDAHQGFSDGENQWETEVLKTVSEELTTERIPQDKAFGNGLFKHTSYSSQQIKAELHEGHWNSDAWQGVDSVMHYAPKSDQQISLFLGDTTERQGSLPKDLQNEAPDHAVRITGANSTGQGLSWNQTVEPFDNLDVRKGMLFGIDRKRVTENLPSADLWTVDKVITGVSATESLYIQDKHFDAFPRYGGVTGDKARAEEH
ncbi:MAG: ABC transporter substrate-binding protein, partial [Halobacteriaceae archaeon]